ncbi:MAG: hypothetical protein ABI445_24225 [Polyangia bacterium]
MTPTKGRPPKNDGEKLTDRVMIRLTNRDLLRLVQLAIKTSEEPATVARRAVMAYLAEKGV